MKGIIYSGEKSYRFNDQGEIHYAHLNPSKEWLLLGAVRYNNFGRPVERIPFFQIQSLNGQWKYKNGKQKWHIIDLDHGTRRTWMSPNHVVIV